MAIGKTFILILGENEPFPNTGSKHPAIFLKKVNPYLGKPTAILGFSDGYGNVFSSILTAEQGTIAGDIAEINIRTPSDGQVLTYSAASNTWVNAEGGGSSSSDLTINSQSGASYVLALTDKNKLLEFARATSITLTIPTNTDVAFPVGSQILTYQAAAGQVTFSASTGVVLISAGAKNKTSSSGSTASLIKVATDSWLLSGDITT